MYGLKRIDAMTEKQAKDLLKFFVQKEAVRRNNNYVETETSEHIRLVDWENQVIHEALNKLENEVEDNGEA